MGKSNARAPKLIRDESGSASILSTDEKKGIIPSLREVARNFFTTGIIQIIFLLLGLFILNRLSYELIENPKRTLEVKVIVYDDEGNPLRGAEITFANKKERGFTNSQGIYKGKVSVRKKEKKIKVNCQFDKYDSISKPLDIPQDKDAVGTTFFNLELSGYFKNFPYPSEDESLSAKF